MPTVKIIICPVCGSNKFKKMLTANDYLVSGESFDIMECEECTLRFTSPLPEEAEIGKYYKSDGYISHSERSISLFDFIYKFIRFFTLRSKRKTVERISQKQSGTLLDVGCGTGDFIKTMQKSGWQVSGVEPDENARNISVEKTGSIILSPSEFLKNNNQEYDVITLWHSLEHLYDLEKYLNKISTSLNANGVVFIAVPNFSSYDAEYYENDWAAYDVPRHLYHFNYDSMLRLMNNFGFEIIEHRQLPFDPFYVSLLSELSVRKKRNIIKTLWVGLRSYWQGKQERKRGSSIIYIFRAKT